MIKQECSQLSYVDFLAYYSTPKNFYKKSAVCTRMTSIEPFPLKSLCWQPLIFTAIQGESKGLLSYQELHTMSRICI